jgi:hypothetical protein
MPPELRQQPVRARAGVGRAQPVEAAEHHEVLAAAEDLVHRRVLPDEPDPPAHLPGLGADVETGDAGSAAVDVDQGGEGLHRGALAGPVRPEQAVDRARRDAQVEAVQSVHVAVPLA